MSAPIILTTQRMLTGPARDVLRRDIEAWDTDDRRKPLVLEDGLSITTLATITVTVMLKDGPLDSVRFQTGLGDLSDLPDAYEYTGGRYVRWVTDDGRQMVTTDGDPWYRWEDAS